MEGRAFSASSLPLEENSARTSNFFLDFDSIPLENTDSMKNVQIDSLKKGQCA
jgi:hypothetical protein